MPHSTKNKKERRRDRTRSKIMGTKTRPRFSVFRSNKYIYGQLIDDKKGETLVALSEKGIIPEEKGFLKKVKREKGEKQIVSSVIKRVSKIERAREVGKVLAQRALEKGITTIIFDRGKYKYHGRVEVLAQGAREGGLKF